MFCAKGTVIMWWVFLSRVSPCELASILLSYPPLCVGVQSSRNCKSNIHFLGCVFISQIGVNPAKLLAVSFRFQKTFHKARLSLLCVSDVKAAYKWKTTTTPGCALNHLCFEGKGKKGDPATHRLDWNERVPTKFHFRAACLWRAVCAQAVIARRASYSWAFTGFCFFQLRLFVVVYFPDFFCVVAAAWWLQVLIWFCIFWLFSVMHISGKIGKKCLRESRSVRQQL